MSENCNNKDERCEPNKEIKDEQITTNSSDIKVEITENESILYPITSQLRSIVGELEANIELNIKLKDQKIVELIKENNELKRKIISIENKNHLLDLRLIRSETQQKTENALNDAKQSSNQSIRLKRQISQQKVEQLASMNKTKDMISKSLYELLEDKEVNAKEKRQKIVGKQNLKSNTNCGQTTDIPNKNLTPRHVYVLKGISTQNSIDDLSLLN